MEKKMCTCAKMYKFPLGNAGKVILEYRILRMTRKHLKNIEAYIGAKFNQPSESI